MNHHELDYTWGGDVPTSHGHIVEIKCAGRSYEEALRLVIRKAQQEVDYLVRDREET